MRLAAELSPGPGPAQSVQLGEREAGRESGAAVLGCRCRCDVDHGDRPCEVSSSRQRVKHQHNRWHCSTWEFICQ